MVRVLACVGIVAAAGLAGCSSLVPNHKDVAPVVGPAPRLNTTPMEPALACLRAQLRKSRRDLRVGVNDFVDGTGVMEGGTQYSHALTQRPDMMMVVALASAGAHLVNRSSVNVAEWELKQAMDKKLGDGRKEMVEGQPVTFRPIRTGVILGSTDYVSGAITELNWNISSGVAEAGAYSASIGKRVYRISLAIDVMVTNTQTTEIVYAKSFKKQLVGFETNANFFRFVNQDSALQIVSLGNAAASTATQALELFNANLGEKQNEPTQVALRWIVDLAAYDIMRKLTRAGQSCDVLLPRENLDDDVLKPPKPAVASAASPAAPANRLAVTPPKEAAPTPETPIARDPKAASLEAPATEERVLEAHAEATTPNQAEATPSASTEKSSRSAQPQTQSGDSGALVNWISGSVRALGLLPRQTSRDDVLHSKAEVASAASPAAPANHLAVASPEKAPPEPRVAAVGDAKAASVRVPVSEKRVAEADAEARPPKRAEVKPSAAKEKRAEAKPSAAKEKRAKTTASVATEKSNANAQNSDGGSNIHWMSGAVPALRPEWSRVGQAGDGQ